MPDTRVVYLEPGKIAIDSIPLPELKPNQILVQTHQASVCGSERYLDNVRLHTYSSLSF